MGEAERKRLRDWQSSSRCAVGSKKSVCLQMSNLINKVLREINVPEMKCNIYTSEEGLSIVSVSYEASKLDFHRMEGTPDQEVLFFGYKNLRVEKSEHDAVSKLASYLMKKYHVQIEDYNFHKLSLAKKELLDVDNNIKVIIANIKDVVYHWKVSAGLLRKMMSDLTVSSNLLSIAVSGEVTTIKCMVEATLQHIDDWMADSLKEYDEYSKRIDSTETAADVTTIKIPETEMLCDILLSLGLEQVKITHILQDNHMFRGRCKFMIPGKAMSKHVGRTVIFGDLKRCPSEAECSAAAQSITFLESSMDLEVVDLSLPVLQDKAEVLEGLQSVLKTYVAIEQYVFSKWCSMVSDLKGLVNSQYAACNEMGFTVDEHDRFHCAEIIEDSLLDITMFFDFFSTIG